MAPWTVTLVTVRTDLSEIAHVTHVHDVAMPTTSLPAEGIYDITSGDPFRIRIVHLGDLPVRLKKRQVVTLA